MPATTALPLLVTNSAWREQEVRGRSPASRAKQGAMHNRVEDCWFVLCSQGVAHDWSGSGWHCCTLDCASLAPWAARMGRKHHSSQSSGRGHCTTSHTEGERGEVEQAA